MNAPWTYQQPERPDGYPSQRYYRRDASKSIEVFRFQSENTADITLTREPGFRMSLRLTANEIVVLRDALSDALQDIATLQVTQQADDDRAASFDLIQNLMDDATETGGPPPHYTHPDVHYVPEAEIADKIAQLEASGCARYLVLAEPAPGRFGA